MPEHVEVAHAVLHHLGGGAQREVVQADRPARHRCFNSQPATRGSLLGSLERESDLQGPTVFKPGAKREVCVRARSAPVGPAAQLLVATEVVLPHDVLVAARDLAR